MTCRVFIATSLDGYIARSDDALDWLPQNGAEETGYQSFISEIDAVVLGRRTYDVVRAFSQWPYGDLRVVVVSNTLRDAEIPAGHHSRLTLHHGDLITLRRYLEDAGVRCAYIDGGRLITSFLALGWIDELTITTIPVLLGSGIPLFGTLPHDIPLEHVRGRTFAGGFVQNVYRIPAAAAHA